MSHSESVVRQVREASRQMVRELDTLRGAFLDSGYTLSQCHVLFELSQHGSLTLMEIAENLLLDKSNTSRTVKKLTELGVIRVDRVQSDNRRKLFSLTKKGETVIGKIGHLANEQVHRALAYLDEKQQKVVTEGLKLYASALRTSRIVSAFTIRPIRKSDDKEVATLIRQVLTEFKAVGEGYSINDPEVDAMSGAYRGDRSCYFVIVRGAKIVGCGGIAPLRNGAASTCELQKMFLLPEARGLGLGRRLLDLLLEEGRARDYRECYLETLSRMDRANELYKRNGFEALDSSMGNTGHCSCDSWYARKL